MFQSNTPSLLQVIQILHNCSMSKKDKEKLKESLTVILGCCHMTTGYVNPRIPAIGDDLMSELIAIHTNVLYSLFQKYAP